MTQTVKATNPVGYIAKYASKGGKTIDFPKGCRMCSSAGLEPQSRWLKSWWLMPRYVRNHFPDYQDRPTRAKGGGFVSKVTGEYLETIYEIVRINPLIIRKKAISP